MIWIIPPPFSAVTQRPGCKRGSWPFCSDTEKPAHTANSLPSVTFYSHKYISPFSNLTPLSPCAQGFVSLPPSLSLPRSPSSKPHRSSRHWSSFGVVCEGEGARWANQEFPLLPTSPERREVGRRAANPSLGLGRCRSATEGRMWVESWCETEIALLCFSNQLKEKNTTGLT